MTKRPFKRAWILGLTVALGISLAAWKTDRDMLPFPDDLTAETLRIVQPQVLDRHEIPLSTTYVNPWNVHDCTPLHRIPPLLRQAFILSEDRRYLWHGGVDWPARFHALALNLAAGRVVRGASTISEQVVRMLHPRPRTVWSRWVEGFEAYDLESRFSKAEILEIYLNQVPYARQRRGVAQAARLYFDRDLPLLNQREVLALVVLVRSPGRLDLFGDPSALDRRIDGLSQRLFEAGLISERDLELVGSSTLLLQPAELTVHAGHYVRHVLAEARQSDAGEPKRRTTLDAMLQMKLQDILDRSLKDMGDRDTANGAILVADHRANEILAWVNGGGSWHARSGSWIDAVTLPRQPGSTLKPFLYSLALEKGWTPATILDDSPLSEPLRSGLHAFRNYSRIHYGPLRLREALGNSLNIPAVRAIQFTGVRAFLDRLRELGFTTLDRGPDHYGQGLALGDGEVSLLELVQAYACLARGGRFLPLAWRASSPGGPQQQPRQVIDDEIASLIAHILADPQARKLEFGEGHLLSLPVETAVKTGTSSDHRDAWAVGFSRSLVVGVWMGNLDRRPTRRLTGTTGPGLVLRAVFAELNGRVAPGPLAISPRLVRKAICRRSGRLPGQDCPLAHELFVPGSEPTQTCDLSHDVRAGTNTAPGGSRAPRSGIQLVQPVAGLELAMDPRVPDSLQAFSLILPRGLPYRKVEWLMDGGLAGTTGPGANRFDWSMTKGFHTVQARLWFNEDREAVETAPVTFLVR
ncbi:MAG: transglycosylase domain-containing protein [Syntrophobacteraceae bacterium]|nr:transglycosylase domain-containing protein [Syntrophobacteraceae bacterium]